MNFLVLSPVLGYSLLVAVAAMILLLHLLRPRALRRTISSTVLWEEVVKVRKKYHAPWRWLLSLLLCLVAGLALALALTQPQGMGAGQTRVVVVLDNSPSMAALTRDGKSRWVHALERARDLIGSTQADILLADTMGHAPVDGFVRPAQAVTALERFTVISHGRIQPLALPALDDIEVHVISDGVTGYELPESSRVHSVFEPADNVAVTGLQTSAFPTDPLRVQAFVQVYNASLVSKRVRLSLRGGDSFSVGQDLQMEAGELIDAVFDVTQFPEGVLAAAAIAADDAFPQDNIAFAMVAPHRVRQIVLVTEDDTRLEDSIRSLPGVRLTTVTPDAYHAGIAADAYVFNAFAPSVAPDNGALLFHPSSVAWLPADRHQVRKPVVSDWERGHALLDGVAWNSLRVGGASLIADASVDVEGIVRTADGALIAAGGEKNRWIVAGFSPEDSNFPLQPGFPVFLGNALNWLNESDPVVSTTLGAFRVPMTGAKVIDGKGDIVNTRAIPGATMFDAAQPDVYTAIADGRRLRVVANALDPRNADINTSRFSDQRAGNTQIVDGSRIEPWIALLVVGLIVLLVEWTAYARRFAT